MCAMSIRQAMSTTTMRTTVMGLLRIVSNARIKVICLFRRNQCTHTQGTAIPANKVKIGVPMRFASNSKYRYTRQQMILLCRIN